MEKYLKIILMKYQKALVASGDTYPVRETLKQLGWKYRGYSREWAIPVKSIEDVREKIKALAALPDGYTFTVVQIGVGEFDYVVKDGQVVRGKREGAKIVPR